jgi:hypothetical protein
MNRLFVFLIFFLCFFVFVNADCFQNEMWFYECTQQRNITLDEVVWQELDLDEMVLDLSEIDIDSPQQCETDFCYEESDITVVVKKVWKPLTSIINSDSLSSWQFAQEFPDIKEENILDNKSSVYDRVVLQKILYDRWLLGVEPTGKIGYLTELAIMKLQCIKWFSEYNPEKTIFEIWSQTIWELNSLKERMKDSNYLVSTELPNIELEDCGPTFVSRYNAISNLMQNPPSWANNNYNNMITPDTSLDREGEVIIKKTE